MSDVVNGLNGTAVAVENEHLEPSSSVTSDAAASAEQPETGLSESSVPISTELHAEKLAQKHADTIDTPSASPGPEKQGSAGKAKNSKPVIESQEEFPTLGKAPAAAAIAPPTWHVGGSGVAAGLNGTSTPKWAPAISVKAGGQLTFQMLAKDSKSFADSKDIGKVVQEVMKKTKTKVDGSRVNRGDYNFVISGGTEQSRIRAKRELARALSKPQIIKLSIPALIRPHIIGKQGSKVQELQTKTLTTIKVPPLDASVLEAFEHEDEAMIEITIEGDVEGCADAVRLINGIVSERAIKVTRQITNCPAQFYPFIHGPFHSKVQEYEKTVDRVIVPDFFYTNSKDVFPPPSGPIEIYGEKKAVEEVRAKIEKEIVDLKARSFTSLACGVKRPIMGFFIQNKAQMIHEIHQETGCIIILPYGTVESILIYGPPESVSEGVKAVNKRVGAFHTRSLDICKRYSKEHARDLVRYVTKQKTLQPAEKETQCQFTFPSGNDLVGPSPTCTVGIVGTAADKVEEAKQRLTAVLFRYTSARFASMDVEPLHHKHINGKDGRGYKRIVDKTSVEILLPEDPEDSRILLVYDGDSTDEKEISRALEEAKELVLENLKGQANIVTEVLSVPSDVHGKIQGENGTTLNALNPGSVLVHFGAPKVQPGKPTPAVNGDVENTITLRGTQNNVDITKKNILKFIQDTKDEANPKPVTFEFTYNAKLSGNLIGQKGANVNKLRDEYGVDINLKEGKGDMRGIQVCVDAAWKKLQAQIKEFEDRAVLNVKVPKDYHSVIIGSEGSTVKRLEEKYHVRIAFPKNGSKSEDAAAEADAPPSRQASDEIIIRGTKKEADEAKKEILELVEYEQENNHTTTIPVAAGAITFMFRNASKDIKQLRDNHPSVRIAIPPEKKELDAATKVDITIKGPRNEIDGVKKALSSIVKMAENTTHRTISVDKKYHRALIGSGGATLKDIVIKAGGPDDRATLARMVRFPGADDNSNEITVQGPKSVVDKIISIIEQIVSEKDNEIVETVDVAPEKHRKLIGREGSVRKELEVTFKVTIDIPRQRPGGQQVSSAIKITGTVENVEKAKERILELIKEPEGLTIEVPRHLHHAVIESTLRLLRDLRVVVDHNGQQKPPKPSLPKPKAPTDLPLITDDQEEEAKIQWDVLENPESSETGTIPWVLRPKGASPEDLAKAKAEIESAIATAEKQNFTGYLILPDPSKHRYVVGPGGHQVDKIRKETGCRIVVPKQNEKGEAIILVGTKEGVEKAKDIIIGLVTNTGNGGGDGGERRRGGRRS